MAATKVVSAETIITHYMDWVLSKSEKPKSIYAFCKDCKMSEQDFYTHFGSFETLEKRVWLAFFEHTFSVIQKNPDYEAYPSKDKLLTFFYTLFELLTANRSYVLFVLKEHRTGLKTLSQLSELRKKIVGFAEELILEDNSDKQSKLTQRSEKIFSEATWLQTLFILRFWLNDSSPSFEKTDLVIEKSVRVVFDVFDSTPLEGLLDFGKFLWKEATV
jgi:hypothetical protein